MEAALFLEQFGHLVDSPRGVSKLRNLILELAVRGQLVQQVPNDESASELLKCIEEEKQRLVKAGKIGKMQPLAPIGEDKIPYEVPQGWEWVRFGQIVFNRDAERIPLSKDERQTRGGEYPYYGASGIIDSIDAYIFDKPLLLIGEDGANLLARSTPIAFIAHGKYWVNNHAHVIDGYNYDFLRYMEVFINAINLEPYVTGTAQPKMNQAKMNSIPVSLPPLAEQQRIVAKVDELMALCDQLEAEQTERDHLREHAAKSTLFHLTNAPSKAESRQYWHYAEQNFSHLFDRSVTVADLRATILQLAVQGWLVPQDPDDEPASELLKRIETEKQRMVKAGEIGKMQPLAPVGEDEMPYKLPRGWEWVRLEAISKSVSDGDHVAPPKAQNGIPFLVISNIINGFVDINGATRFVPEEYFDGLAGYRVPKRGDILYTVTGSIGVPVIVEVDDKFCFQRHIGIVKCLPLLNIWYLHRALQSPVVREMSINTATGIAQKTIPLSGLRQLLIPLPPLAEQQRIVAKVDELMALCDQLRAEADTCHALSGRLFDSIVHHLFEPSNAF